MNRISSPHGDMKPSYDVIVIGSGYGGAIAASRLSRAGKKVCVLERGKERQPGEYPANVLEGAEEMQFDLPKCHQGSRTGLYDFHVNPDISVLVGCGLGGTSLINANVSIRPDPRVFTDPLWPAALRAEEGKRMEAGLDLAETMLGAAPYPESQPKLPKLIALEKSAKAMGKGFFKPKINVTFADGYNYAGVRQNKCTLCGDCASGCNHNAKNTVLMNYLPDAKRHGAEIFVETSVRWVEQAPDGRWIAHFQVLNTGRESFDAPTLFVTADIIILAAGALGSTETLLRSRDAGKISVSDRLGHGFSGNGDMLGFGYNGTPEIRSIGLGNKPMEAGREIGPCITGVIDMRDTPDWRDGIIIEEGAAPAPLALLLHTIMKVASIGGGAVNTTPSQFVAQQARAFESATLGPYHGATSHTQTYLGMCHEGTYGAMKLDRDRLRIEWLGVGSRPIFATLNERLIDSTRPLEGIYVANPIWGDDLGKSLISVHPLGGCNMADSAESGVVDHRGKVFTSSVGTSVYEGLYVCDGAIIPTSVGVNPLLTISALAERCCMIIAEERGWTIDYTKKGPITEAPVERTVGIRFTETMSGWFGAAPPGDFAAGAAIGREKGASLRFILTVTAEDLDDMIEGAEHLGRMVGTVTAPSLSPSPLVATQGIFNLFVEVPSSPGTRQMRYRMVLSSEDGRFFYFNGFKVIRDKRPFWDVWNDTTTLYVTLHEGASEAGPVIATGVLRITSEDFIRQLATIDATNTESKAERIAATVKFGRYFAGVLFDHYGGVAAPKLFGVLGNALPFSESDAPPRKRRPLRTSAPEFFPIKASDGADILLTRYSGGGKGPVILAHGMGTSSQTFSIDTIDTNLLEYLFAAGYDVWLLDYRASTMLPTSSAQHAADDVAKRDWPAAVAAVRAATGAASVQVVAHCLGAITFTMAMLAGLEGVRAAVCSQVATHLVTPKLSLLKGGLYAPGFVPALELTSLRAAAASTEDWIAPLYERALTLDRTRDAEECEVAACDRITFMYAPLYEHAQLDPTTHTEMGLLFGDTHAELFESIAAMVKKGQVVDASGADVYLPAIARLAIPIRFIHGAENQCFLPESTEKTVAALGAANDPTLYSREVIAGYGHGDCLFGKNAAVDVYPHILDHLTKPVTPGSNRVWHAGGEAGLSRSD